MEGWEAMLTDGSDSSESSIYRDTPRYKQARLIHEQTLTNIQTVREWIKGGRVEQL